MQTVMGGRSFGAFYYMRDLGPSRLIHSNFLYVIASVAYFTFA